MPDQRDCDRSADETQRKQNEDIIYDHLTFGGTDYTLPNLCRSGFTRPAAEADDEIFARMIARAMSFDPRVYQDGFFDGEGLRDYLSTLERDDFSVGEGGDIRFLKPEFKERLKQAMEGPFLPCPDWAFEEDVITPFLRSLRTCPPHVIERGKDAFLEWYARNEGAQN